MKPWWELEQNYSMYCDVESNVFWCRIIGKNEDGKCYRNRNQTENRRFHLRPDNSDLGILLELRVGCSEKLL